MEALAAELIETKREINAIKFVLSEGKVGEQSDYVVLYTGQSKQELQDSLRELQVKENILLNQQQQAQQQAAAASAVASPKLADGLPKLVQNLTFSPPSIPPEEKHASCERESANIFIEKMPENIRNSNNSAWNGARIQNDSEKCLFYCSEADVVYILRQFLESVVIAMSLPFQFAAEIAVHRIRPDIMVLMADRYPVGVVEVKKPGLDILMEPTVLGELLDQMLLVQGFYGVGPIVGILTSGEEWLLAWFPEDNQVFQQPIQPAAEFVTPQKVKNAGKESNSPPGNTPSQKQGGKAHSIIDIPVLSTEDEEEEIQEIERQMARRLSTTKVFNMNHQKTDVLDLLHTAFLRMSKARFNQSSISNCLLMFHKDLKAVTFHPMSYGDVVTNVDFSKFPRSNTKHLLALEDLGRGSTGKAWLAVTNTKSQSAVCVMKFDNKNDNSNLEDEKINWNRAYPEFSTMTKVEKWSGSFALVMPHFATILEDEREQFRDAIRSVLEQKFESKGLVHRDVRWRNIGKYTTQKGEEVPVVYDLLGLVEYNVDKHADWIDKAMQYLYAEVGTTKA